MDRTTLMTRLAAVALLLLLPTVAMGYSFKVDGIYYNTIGNGNVEVTYLSTLMPGTYCGDITIPDSVTFRDKTYHVTAIGDEAFTNCIYLKNITLPNCIERIGDYAFRECTKLDNITIPTMVKSIGKYAFNNCKFLDVTCLSVSPPAIDGSATFTCCPTATLHVPPQSVIAYRSALYWQDFAEIARDATGYIVDYLYDFVVDGIYYNVEDGQATVTNNGHTGCYSGDVVIPEEVTYGGMTYPVVAIGDSAFKNCTALTSITPANSIATIGISAFENCTGLTTITIPESVTLIYSPAFDGCTGVRSLIFNAVNYQYTLSFRKLPIDTLIFGEHVQLVPACLMGHSQQLKSVTFSNSVTTIGVGAFQNCPTLTQLDLPPSLNTIEGYAFDGCTGLTSITTPDAVTKIADNAFSGCSGLSEFSFGDSVATIGNYAFENCSGLTTVNLPNSVTTIGKYAFKGCSELTSVAMGSNVTSIGNMMVFSGCDQLTSLTCLATEPPTIGSEGNNLLVNRYWEHTTVHVLPGVVEAYQSAAYWHYFYQILGDASGDINGDGADFVVDGIYYHVEDGQATVTNNGHTGCYSGDVVIPEEVTYGGMTYPVVAIGDSAFKNCTALTSITLGDSIKTIEASAFQGCSGLTSITIPEAVTMIRSNAFAGCSGIKSVVFNPVNYDYALHEFRDCPVETLVFGNHVQQIPDFIMEGHSQLKNVTIPHSVTRIRGHAFKNCSGLTQVNLPSSLKTIDFNAFENCTSLNSITIPDSVTSIKDYAFRGCSALDSVIIGNAVTDINLEAFSGCSGMRTLVIGNAVTTIGDQAFENCAKLTTVTIPNSVTTIGNYAFSGCSGLVSATIGYSVTTIGNVMFCYCSQLTEVTCLTATPPTFLYAGPFDNRNYYANATLHVLPEAIEAYQSAEYWKDFSLILGDAARDNIPGDVNGDGVVNVSDANSVIDVIINGGSHSSGHGRAPSNDDENNPANGYGDMNGDGTVNIADLNAIIQFIINH